MKYVQCPDSASYEDLTQYLPVFMAGGITNCPNWQEEYKELMSDTKGILLINPRRRGFNVREDGIAEEQIKWEHDHLQKAKVITFWFPCETLCPITLLELGKYMVSKDKKIFVCTHPDYQRRVDVIEQLRHERPEVHVLDSIQALAAQVKVWWSTISMA